MGQGCCIPVDPSGEVSAGTAKPVNSKGWRSLVQSVVDFERMDRSMNRWRQHDILYLQVLAFAVVFGLEIEALSIYRVHFWKKRLLLRPKRAPRISTALNISLATRFANCSWVFP